MEKYLLVQYLNSLNKVIRETFKSTQRIKLTSFDVSAKYVIFGASSGGIYVFKRSPCEFIKIIPSKEGSTVQIRISCDEKHLAIASSKGTVVILDSFFTDLTLRPLLHNVHEGNILTALEWHSNNLYCGDNTGKVSVFTIISLLTKAIFQIPSAVLMHLDSSIVQIDAYLQYLLISTKTRTYLCDTEQEQYKQIGKKLRDGSFGACFCKMSNLEITGAVHETRGMFKTIREDEQFSMPLKNNDTKIFCARPGSRLWEASFETEVLVTYQFKNSLEQSKSDLILIQDEFNTDFEVSSCMNLESFNFGKIYPIYRRFIFTYDAEGIYFCDPLTNSVPFWNTNFKNIIDVKISDKCVFIWQKHLQMNVISLQLLEDLLLDTLARKQYYFCAGLCTNYKEDLINLIKNESRKVSTISILKDKLFSTQENELLDKLKDVFDLLDNNYKEQTLVKRIENGVSVVDNKFLDQSDFYIPESVQNYSNCDQHEVTKYKEENKLDSLYKQYILNKTHKKAELTECSRLLQSISLNDVILLLNDFVNYAQEKEAEDWCESQIIKIASIKSDLCDVDVRNVKYLSQIYLKKNISKDYCFKCKYPLPKAHLNKLNNYNLATMLYDISENKQEYLDNIPCLYKNYLRNLSDIKPNLPLFIQYNDETLIRLFLNKFNYDMWDDTIKLFYKLKRGFCLNCGENIDIIGVWKWTKLGILMIESMGAKNATRLLKRYSQYIPKGELDAGFYQCCLLAAAQEDSSCAVNFTEQILESPNRKLFGEAVGKFLQKKYLGKEFECKIIANAEKCFICGHEIKGPILNEYKKCSNCKIYFHNICVTDSDKICKNCLNGIV